MGGETSGDGVAGRVVGEASWAVPTAGAIGGGGLGREGRAVLVSVGGNADKVGAGDGWE